MFAELGGAAVTVGKLQADDLVRAAGRGVVPARGVDPGERGPGEDVLVALLGVGAGAGAGTALEAEAAGADLVDDLPPGGGREVAGGEDDRSARLDAGRPGRVPSSDRPRP